MGTTSNLLHSYAVNWNIFYSNLSFLKKAYQPFCNSNTSFINYNAQLYIVK